MLTQIAQLVLSLSILIILHELGHFIPARIFKTRVEKFYLFFDPYFSLFKIKKGDTEYGIGWLPLGGYVKISGMIDESMDKEQMKLPPQDWEFRSKPAWQRLIIMLGGVTVNLILGFLIYAMILFAWGDENLPMQNVTNGIGCDSLALNMGLRDGDKVLSVDNTPVKNYNEVLGNVIFDQAKSIQVEREGKKVDVAVTDHDISEIIKNNGKMPFISPRTACFVDSVIPDLSAAKVGLKKGDQVISINDKPTEYFIDVTRELKKNRNNSVSVSILRKGDTLTIKTPVSAEGTIGFTSVHYSELLKMDTIHYSFFEAFPAGISKSKKIVVRYIQQLGIIFTVKDAHKQIGGYGSMVKAFNKEWDWEAFWGLTAFISLALAIMNLLPIPALDGGHVMFLLYEVITGRKPNEKFMEIAQYVGLAIIVALLLYANANDVIRAYFK